MNVLKGRYGAGQRPPPLSFCLCLVLVLACLLMKPAPGRAESEPQNPPLRPVDPAYVAGLLEKAGRLQLDRDRYWLTLLHHKKTMGGNRSLVDDPKFFLAPDGKDNPEGELRATLEALFRRTDDIRNHAVCRFAARSEWLREKLDIDSARLPHPECPPLNRMIENIRPESVTLVFPTAHVNSPASMFGHTLLTIDSDSRTKLLSQSINYSAVTTETFGPLFAVRGLFGSYKGYFSILPYYAKLQEYSDIDRRDLWEYRLNLNGEEIRRLLMHAYEMDMIYSDYFFFDENCSYNLLFLLDAARPSLDLTDRFGLWVIPLDTIRAVRDSGMVSEIRFRPSRTARIEQLSAPLSSRERLQSVSIAAGGQSPDRIGGGQDTRVLDLASEYLQYLYAERKLKQPVYANRFRSILMARSALGAQGNEEAPPEKTPARPEDGHQTMRVSAGAGLKHGRGFQELSFRPVYHDLLDNPKGYVEGAQISFMNTALRSYPNRSSLRIERLDAIDILSISPRDEFFSPVSWKIVTGLFRRDLSNEDDAPVIRVNPGAGIAYHNRLLGLWYIMPEADLNIGPLPDHYWSAGIGGSAGIIRNVADGWKVHLYVRDLYYGLGFRQNTLEVGFSQNYCLTTNTALRFDLIRRESSDYGYTEAKLSWNLYF